MREPRYSQKSETSSAVGCTWDSNRQVKANPVVGEWKSAPNSRQLPLKTAAIQDFVKKSSSSLMKSPFTNLLIRQMFRVFDYHTVSPEIRLQSTTPDLRLIPMDSRNGLVLVSWKFWNTRSEMCWSRRGLTQTRSFSTMDVSGFIRKSAAFGRNHKISASWLVTPLPFQVSISDFRDFPRLWTRDT